MVTMNVSEGKSLSEDRQPGTRSVETLGSCRASYRGKSVSLEPSVPSRTGPLKNCRRAAGAHAKRKRGDAARRADLLYPTAPRQARHVDPGCMIFGSARRGAGNGCLGMHGHGLGRVGRDTNVRRRSRPCDLRVTLSGYAMRCYLRLANIPLSLGAWVWPRLSRWPGGMGWDGALTETAGRSALRGALCTSVAACWLSSRKDVGGRDGAEGGLSRGKRQEARAGVAGGRP